MLLPQHSTLPPERSAQAKLPPTVTEVTPLVSVGTATGIGLVSVDPFPSSPELLSPQQYTAPSTVTAHADSAPAATCAMFPTPEENCAVTGVALSDVMPSPSWPEPLAPQHSTIPSLIAHAKSPSMPAATAVVLFVNVGLFTGVGLSGRAVPGIAQSFPPQHETLPDAPSAHANPVE